MITLESRIAAVTVYPNRARVVRRATLDVEAGVQQIALTGLPAALDRDSLRASARGTARARLLGVELSTAFATESAAARTREQETHLDELVEADRVLADREETLTKRIDHLDGLIGASDVQVRALTSGRMSVDAHRLARRILQAARPGSGGAAPDDR